MMPPRSNRPLRAWWLAVGGMGSILSSRSYHASRNVSDILFCSHNCVIDDLTLWILSARPGRGSGASCATSNTQFADRVCNPVSPVTNNPSINGTAGEVASLLESTTFVNTIVKVKIYENFLQPQYVLVSVH